MNEAVMEVEKYHQLLATLPEGCDYDEDENKGCQEGNRCSDYWSCLVHDVVENLKFTVSPYQILKWILEDKEASEEDSPYDLAQAYQLKYGVPLSMTIEEAMVAWAKLPSETPEISLLDLVGEPT